jgi:hypothetical protein
VVDWGFHRRYLERLGDVAPPEPSAAEVAAVGAATFARLGHLRPPDARRDAFAHFPREKRPGTVRIGCFGDSFTWGDEVDDGYDYPAQLQALARARGRPDVEVINFGNSAYGMHQSWILWDEVGRGYDLDHLVLVTQPYWPNRDTTFTTPSAAKLVLHSRFVLDRGDLVRVDPIGTTERERTDRYDAFLPPFRYLRYDRVPPAFLRALLPEGRAITNPFYYDGRRAQREAFETYRILLARFAAERPDALVVDGAGPFLPLVPKTGRLRGLRPRPGGAFLYRAPKGHASPWGNRLLAEQILAALTGTGGFERLVFADAPAPAAGAPETSLAACAGLHVDLDDLPVAGLYEYGPSRRTATRVDDPPAARLPALVAVRLGRQSWADAALVPPAAPPGAGPPAVTLDDGERTVRLGTVEPFGLGGLGRFDLCAALASSGLAWMPAEPRCVVPRGWRPRRARGRRVRVLVGGAPLMAATVGRHGTVTLAPPGRWFQIAADGWVEPAVARLAAAGTVFLSCERSGAPPVRIPIATWSRAAR